MHSWWKWYPSYHVTPLWWRAYKMCDCSFKWTTTEWRWASCFRHELTKPDLRTENIEAKANYLSAWWHFTHTHTHTVHSVFPKYPCTLKVRTKNSLTAAAFVSQVLGWRGRADSDICLLYDSAVMSLILTFLELTHCLQHEVKIPFARGWSLSSGLSAMIFFST